MTALLVSNSISTTPGLLQTGLAVLAIGAGAAITLTGSGLGPGPGSGSGGGRQYLFQPPEHGVLVELYLPKRADFQGVLYDTLTDAFDAAKIRGYLADPHGRGHVVALLERHWPKLVGRLDAIAARLEGGIQGYTLYEVDGVYAGVDGVVSERSQVVRIMFLPRLDGLADRITLDPDPERNRARLRDAAKVLLRDYGADRGALTQREPQVRPEILALCEALEGWVDEVGLILFGFIMGRVCVAIRDRNLRPEEEIWATSTWGFTLNALRFREGDVGGSGMS